MDLSQLLAHYPTMSITLLGLATIAGVKLVRSLFHKQYESAAVIVVAALLPATLSAMVDGITPLVGAIVGLAFAGVITTADRLAGRG